MTITTEDLARYATAADLPALSGEMTELLLCNDPLHERLAAASQFVARVLRDREMHGLPLEVEREMHSLIMVLQIGADDAEALAERTRRRSRRERKMPFGRIVRRLVGGVR